MRGVSTGRFGFYKSVGRFPATTRHESVILPTVARSTGQTRARLMNYASSNAFMNARVTNQHLLTALYEQREEQRLAFLANLFIGLGSAGIMSSAFALLDAVTRTQPSFVTFITYSSSLLAFAAFTTSNVRARMSKEVSKPIRARKTL